MTTVRRRVLVALAGLAVLGIAAALAFQLALRQLHSGIEAALGPRATLQTLSLSLTGVELRGLRVRAAQGRWPATEELVADRVHVVPSLSSLWRSGWHVASVTVEGASLSLLRTRDGKLRVLPSMLEASDGKESSSSAGASQRMPVRIAELQLRDVAIDFYDATVAASQGGRGAPHRVRLEPLHATVGPLVLPALDERVNLSLKATLKGPQRNGTLSLQGHLTPATRDADLALKVKGVDLIALAPYLLRANEATVRRGTLDMALDAKVKGQRLTAPGQLALSELDLASSGGVMGTFAGVPRQAVLAAMSRDGRIELAFTLQGRIDDPKFSVNEAFAARVAVGLAEKLGVSIGGVVEGVGSVIKGLFGR